ncbi:MAG TPA: ATP-binding protein [Aquihabitans sp.]|nr:ATP-binding protein [Aquihabitans sp.]
MRIPTPQAPAADGSTEILTATYPADVMSVGGARVRVEDALRDAGRERYCERAVEVIDELVWNVVLHAGTDVEVHVSGGQGHVLLEVADGAPGGLVVLSGEASDLAGHGLAVVDELADDWGWRSRDHGKVVWARLDGEVAGVAAGSGAG